MRRNAVPISVILVSALLVGLLVYGVASTGGTSTTLDDAVKRGERPPAPGLDLPRPKLGAPGEGRISDYGGKIIVLNVWASWCEPCKDEVPALKAVHERLAKAKKGTVLGLTFEDASADSIAFEKEFDVRYPSLRDVGSDLYEEFGGTGIPETFVIDPQGRVVALSRGQVDLAFLDRALDRLGA